MAEQFKLIKREHGEKAVTADSECSLYDSRGYDLTFLSQKEAQKVRDFHKSFPMYASTPLAHLPETAKCLGLGDVYVKDESCRFGLNAFKVLGGSYAIGNYLAGIRHYGPGSL